MRALLAFPLTAGYCGIASGVIGLLIGLPVYLAIANAKVALALLAVPFYP